MTARPGGFWHQKKMNIIICTTCPLPECVGIRDPRCGLWSPEPVIYQFERWLERQIEQAVRECQAA